MKKCRFISPPLFVFQGGENTPLHDSGGSFSSMTPQHKPLATPNHVLSTPYRSASAGTQKKKKKKSKKPEREGAERTVSSHAARQLFFFLFLALTPAGGKTPADVNTPLRDKLHINQDASDLSLLTPRTCLCPSPLLLHCSDLCVAFFFFFDQCALAGTHAERERQMAMRAELKSDLKQLPKPKQDYDVVVPDVAPESEPGKKK